MVGYTQSAQRGADGVESMGRSTKILGGRYELGEPIGSGGMGTVHRARHVELGHRVAVKRLKEELARRPEMRARFEREARAAARIEHDNVCQVIEVGEDGDGVPCYVMPLLRGRTLDREIKGEGSLEVGRAVDIAAQILAALAAIHDAGLIHRDLKPSNVFLTTVGDREDFVKILDFGISKRIAGEGELAATATLTEQGKLIGTPFYMAPEQAKGRKDSDHRIDIYALGLILYEMLTGRRPMAGDDIHEILTNIFFTPVTPPRSLRGDIPEPLEAVILKAMSRDPGDRYPSARAMAEALCPAAAGSKAPAACLAPTLDETAPDMSAELEGDAPTPFAVETPPPEKIEPARPRRRVSWQLALTIVLAAFGVAALTLGALPDQWRQPSDERAPNPAVRAPADEPRAAAPEPPAVAEAAAEASRPEATPDAGPHLAGPHLPASNPSPSEGEGEQDPVGPHPPTPSASGPHPPAPSASEGEGGAGQKIGAPPLERPPRARARARARAAAHRAGARRAAAP